MGILTRFMFYFILFTGVFFYWDINKNKSIYTNQVKLQLEKYGLLESTLELIEATKNSIKQIQKFISIYLPPILERSRKASIKYASILWSNIKEYSRLASEYIQPFGDQLLVYLNDTFKIIQQNLPTLIENLTSLYYLFLNYTSTMRTFIVQYATLALNAIELNLLGWKEGELAAIFSNIIAKFVQWINQSALYV